jgi:hypothetical protein
MPFDFFSPFFVLWLLLMILGLPPFGGGHKL